MWEGRAPGASHGGVPRLGVRAPSQGPGRPNVQENRCAAPAPAAPPRGERAAPCRHSIAARLQSTEALALCCMTAAAAEGPGNTLPRLLVGGASVDALLGVVGNDLDQALVDQLADGDAGQGAADLEALRHNRSGDQLDLQWRGSGRSEGRWRAVELQGCGDVAPLPARFRPPRRRTFGISVSRRSYVFWSKSTAFASFSWTLPLFHFFFLDLPPAMAARALASLDLISTFACRGQTHTPQRGRWARADDAAGAATAHHPDPRRGARPSAYCTTRRAPPSAVPPPRGRHCAAIHRGQPGDAPS